MITDENKKIRDESQLRSDEEEVIVEKYKVGDADEAVND